MKIKFNNIKYALIMLVCMIIVNLFKLDIAPTLGIYILIYVMVVYYFYSFHKSWKNMFTSIEFIYLTVYIMYAIFSSIMFLMDNGGQRQWYFTITYDTMKGTLTLYFNVFVLLCLILLVFNYPKKNIFEDQLMEKNINLIRGKKYYIIFDFGACVCLLIFFYACIRNGLAFFSNDFGTRRVLAEFSMQQYVWLYMMVYSVVMISEIDIQSITTNFAVKNKRFKLLVIMSFWILSIFVDRRHIISVLIAIFIVHLSKFKRLKMRTAVISIFVVVGFLIYAIIRAGLRVGIEFDIVFYTAMAEFILTGYVSCYYYANPVLKLKFGTTYVWDTITRIFPRSIFPWKPEDLASVFAQKVLHGENGYAFNPVAEGLINFGYCSIITTPIIIFLIIRLGSKEQKKNPLFYAILCGYSLDFCRGQFANSMFDLFVMYVLLKLMSRVRVNSKS